jgi:regulator of protease activity HflC (stomatin/prohibitin superfamily)
MKKKKLKDYSDEELARMDYNTKERLILEDKIHKIVKYVLLAIIVIFLIITFFNSFKTIPTGFIGVKTRFGQVQDTMLNEGLNLKIPFIEKIVLMDCRTQKTEYTMEASSKDLQKISNYKIAINYNITKDTANQLYKSVGVDYKNIIVEPAIQSVMKDSVANFTAEELITKRSEVAQFALDRLTEKFQNSGITLTGLDILDLSFSEEFDTAVEQKQIVEQETQKAQYELEKARVENQKKIENAQADAEVMAAQNAQITDNYLRLKEIENQKAMIEKWNGQLPTTMTGSDVSSIFNVN